MLLIAAGSWPIPPWYYNASPGGGSESKMLPLYFEISFVRFWFWFWFWFVSGSEKNQVLVLLWVRWPHVAKNPNVGVSRTNEHVT